MSREVMDTHSHRNQGSNRSMIFIHWKDAVMSEARATYEETVPHAARLGLWFNSGEPVWLAADGLKLLIKGSKSAERAERERRFLAHTIKTAANQGEDV